MTLARRMLWIGLAVLVTASAIAAIWMQKHSHILGNDYWGDYTFQYYMDQVGLPQDISVSELREQGYEVIVDEDGIYRKVYLEGFRLGYMGLYEIGGPCAIFTDSKDAPKIFRKGLGVGSSLDDLLKAYPDAHTMEGENDEPCGLILDDDGHELYAGIWIYYETDAQGIITSLDVTNGF